MKPTTLFPLTKEPEPATTAQVRPWVIRLARLGYIAKGTIFLVVGLLAAKATFALGGKLTDQVGTLQIIDHQPLGQLLLSLLAAGLLAHALWQGLLALLDPEQKGTTLAGLTMRTGFAISSVLYGGLAISAIRILWGAGDQNSEGGTEHLTAQVLAYPLGPWLVGLVGMGMVGLGLYQFYKVYTTRFLTELDWAALDRPTRWWVTGSGYLGHLALGVVLLLSGSFLLQAAVKLNPQLAGGIQQVLQTLARPPYSPWSVAAIAVGLVAYGCFTFTLACYAHCLFAYDPDQA